MPGDGQIVLLKTPDGPLVALRTRKLYSEQRFAGQVVRDFSPDAVITTGASYTAMLKIRDLIIDPSEITEAPPNDLDIELDRGRFADKLTSSEELELRSLMFDEVEDYEQERSFLGFRLAVVRLPAYSDGYLFLAASGLRFSQTLIHPLLFYSKKAQDSLGFDVTGVFTKVNDYTPSQGDSFSLLPLTISGRYSVFLSQSLQIYGYAGVMRTFILSSIGDGAEYLLALDQLETRSQLIGVGLSVELGPQWLMQFELGTDQAGINMGLKF